MILRLKERKQAFAFNTKLNL